MIIKNNAIKYKTCRMKYLREQFNIDVINPMLSCVCPHQRPSGLILIHNFVIVHVHVNISDIRY